MITALTHTISHAHNMYTWFMNMKRQSVWDKLICYRIIRCWSVNRLGTHGNSVWVLLSDFSRLSGPYIYIVENNKLLL